MNYLAHALLSEPYAHSLIGNLAGDLVKGPLERHELHPRVADGVRRHRRVDALTDAHPAYHALKKRFPGGEYRYAGIVLDVVFDYYLTRHWQRFSRWDYDRFTADVYGVLREHRSLQPAELARVSERWAAHRWLDVYATREGLEMVLGRLSARLARPVDLAVMLSRVDREERAFEAGFLQVFGDVQQTITGH